MKKIFVILLMVPGFNNSIAQTHVRDSLHQLLNTGKKDTSRVIHLANLSFQYQESAPDTAMLYALEALTLARSLGFEKGEAESLNRVANANHTMGNYSMEMEFLLQALKINQRIRNQDGIQKNYNNIGNIYNDQGDDRQALEYYFKAVPITNAIGNREGNSIANSNIATLYFRLKILDSARIFAQHALDTAYKINYSRLIGVSLSRLGTIHFEKNEQPLALEYYRLSLPYSLVANNYWMVSATYLRMANVFEKTGAMDSVLYYARKSLQIATEKNFAFYVREAGTFLATYFEARNADTAVHYLKLVQRANDSLFGLQKARQIQSMAFAEKLRQIDITAAELKAKKERNHNLQYVSIVIGLITLLILFFLLSHSIIVKTRFISFLAVMGLLAVFEFINLFLHPYVSAWTNDSPVWMLIILMAIGALLVPIHHKLEQSITKRMVEKNKKIRLKAAKKTIAELEPDKE